MALSPAFANSLRACGNSTLVCFLKPVHNVYIWCPSLPGHSEDGHRRAKEPWESCVILSRDRSDSGKALAGLYRVHRYESLVARACRNGWYSKLTEQNVEIASHGSGTANVGFELPEIRE